MWEYWIHDLRTGEPQVQVYPSDCSWTRRFSSRGDGSFTFPVTDRTSIPRFGAGHELLRPYDRVIVVRWGDFVAYAGYVREWTYEQRATVTAKTSEIRGLFARRLMGRPMEYGPDWNLSYTNRSADGAVNVILNRATSLTTEYWVPLDLPPYGAGGLSRQVRFWETVTADDLLTEVEDTGAIVDFDPYMSGGSLRWQVDAGAVPDRGTLDLVVGAPGSAVTGLSVKLNGDKQASGVLAVGKGSGADMMTAYATDASANVPALVQKVDAKDFDRVAEVAAAARQVIKDRLWPTEQWSFGVHLGDVTPADVQLGTLLRLDVRGDDWLSDGMREKRVIAVKGGMSMTLTPEVQ